MSGFYEIASGLPFSVNMQPPSDQMNANPFLGEYRANLIGPAQGGAGFTRSPLTWYNVSSFAAPALGTYGDSGKGLLRGPYISGLDMSFAKSFRLAEQHHLKYRLDIFNLGTGWHYYQNAGKILGSMNSNGMGGFIPNNGLGNLNFWSPGLGQAPPSHTIQMSLVYTH